MSTPSSAPGSLTLPGAYNLVNPDTNKRLGVLFEGGTWVAELILEEVGPSPSQSQAWRVTEDANGYQIYHIASGQYLAGVHQQGPQDPIKPVVRGATFDWKLPAVIPEYIPPQYYVIAEYHALAVPLDGPIVPVLAAPGVAANVRWLFVRLGP
ncbi:hypothetical protein K439DRAFT_1636049, partial [Ramaria rubella]